MKNRNVTFILLTVMLNLVLQGCNSNSPNKTKGEERPNIVIIYLDDLGYGDVSAYGAGELKTPAMDELANNGIMFTDAHASSATCTPSRFALLTGMYPWKNKQAKILPGTAPLIIDTAMATLPKMLQQEGYHTGIVGKWHLGLGDGQVNWNEPISPGPNDVGFDYSYIMAATQDRVPTVYIEDGLVVGLDPEDPIQVDYQNNFEGEPTGKDNPELLTMKWHHGHNSSIVNGIPRIGFMKGGEKAKWSDIDMADHFLEKAREYVAAHKDGPFFLYYAMQQPHVPRTPHPRFEGATSMGPRGDVIAEADWCVGEFMKTLEEEGLLENTLIILSSDNGPVLNDGYYDDAVEKLGEHTPWGIFRGGKYSLFEAGTRVPFIVYWKGRIAPKVSDALVSQLDIFTSISNLLGSEISGPDSEDLLDVFMGTSDQGREQMILEATSRTALRKGKWVLIPPYEGWAVNTFVNIELGNSKEIKLYDLDSDPGQKENVASENEELAGELLEEYLSIVGELEVEELELK